MEILGNVIYYGAAVATIGLLFAGTERFTPMFGIELMK